MIYVEWNNKFLLNFNKNIKYNKKLIPKQIISL